MKIKQPPWFRVELARVGRQVADGRMTEAEAVKTLVELVLAKDPEFTHLIVAAELLARLRHLKVVRKAAKNREAEQPALFPELPRRIETSPGRFADQAVMTRRDWWSAIKQARTKASNATGYADEIQAAADKVLPLLTDDELTTADVWAAAA